MARDIVRAQAIRALRAVAFVAAFAASGFAQKVCMTAVLDGAQEAPPTPSTAKGTAFVVVDRTANTLTYYVAWEGGLSETAANIHGFSPPGVNSGVLSALPLGKFKTGVLAYAEANEVSLLNGLCYINIHSTGFVGGEIRGQLTRSNAHFTMFCVSDGVQEVPPSLATGKGVGWFKFNIVANSITYSYTHFGLTGAETLALIHGFAAPGVNAGGKIALPAGVHKNGVVVYPAADEANYLAGLAYLNIHTTAFPGGEIRGQLMLGSSNPTQYCNSKTNSQGCQPQASWIGLPTLSPPYDFHVTATLVINNKLGLMFWGYAPLNTPFLGGTMCVASPTIRTPVQNSGGNAPPDDCSGTYDFHFSAAYMAGQGVAVGQLVHFEYWYRDPADPFTVGFSNAVAAEILP